MVDDPRGGKPEAKTAGKAGVAYRGKAERQMRGAWRPTAGERRQNNEYGRQYR